MIHIASSEYNARYQALEIYLSGCTIRCPDCHNRELWEVDATLPDWESWMWKNRHKWHAPLVRRLWLMGGDPLCQEWLDLRSLLHFLVYTGKEVWLWTGKDSRSVSFPSLAVCKIPYIKTGAYTANSVPVTYAVDENERITLASGNQQLYKLQPSGEYEPCPTIP